MYSSGDVTQKGLLFDIHAHHNVAREPDKAPGKRHGYSWAIKAMS